MTPEQSADYRTALIALAREEVDDAEVILVALAAELPEDADVRAFLAAAWGAQGRIEDAIETMSLALTLGPKRFAPNIKAGELDLRLGDLDAAVLHFKQALKAAEHGSRDAAAARTLLGETRQRAGRSIVRQASFPRWHRPAFMKRRADRLLTTPVEDGGIIE